MAYTGSVQPPVESDSPRSGAAPGRPVLPAIVRPNADVAGLVQLYVRFSAEATDPANSAHSYFAEALRDLPRRPRPTVGSLQDEGRISAAVDPNGLAAVLVAAMDGPHLQRLFDPSLDMAACLASLFDALLVWRTSQLS